MTSQVGYLNLHLHIKLHLLKLKPLKIISNECIGHQLSSVTNTTDSSPLTLCHICVFGFPGSHVEEIGTFLHPKKKLQTCCARSDFKLNMTNKGVQTRLHILNFHVANGEGLVCNACRVHSVRENVLAVFTLSFCVAAWPCLFLVLTCETYLCSTLMSELILLSLEIL